MQVTLEYWELIMGILELGIIAIGLSMDAFAVSVCKGLSMKNHYIKNALIIGLFFGGFQAIMPIIGYTAGWQFKAYIVSFDHWIAFFALSAIGIKMIVDSKKTCPVQDGDICFKTLILLAIATSIDALIVGITLSFLEVNLLEAIGTIGIITFILSAVGVGIGHKFGSRFNMKTELIGGLTLIVMGTKILIEHLI